MKDKEILNGIYKTIKAIGSRVGKYSASSDMSFADFAFCAYAHQTLINICQKISRDSVIHSSSPKLSQKLFAEKGLFLNDTRLVTAHNPNLFKVYKDNKSAIINLYRTELVDILELTEEVMNDNLIELPTIALSANSDIEFDELEPLHNYVKNQISAVFNKDQKLPKDIVACYVNIIVDRYLSVTYKDAIEARAAHRLLQQSIVEILKNCAKRLAINNDKSAKNSELHQELSKTVISHLQQQPVRNEYAHAISLDVLTSRDQSASLLEFELSDPNLQRIFAEKSFSDMIMGFRKSTKPKQELEIEPTVELKTTISTNNNTKQLSKNVKNKKKKNSQAPEDLDEILKWIEAPSAGKIKKPKAIQEQEKLKKQQEKEEEQQKISLERLPTQTIDSIVLTMSGIKEISKKLSELVVRMIKLIQTDEVSLAQAYFKKVYMMAIEKGKFGDAKGILPICAQIKFGGYVDDSFKQYFLMDKIVEFNNQNYDRVIQLIYEFEPYLGYFNFLPAIEQVEELVDRDLHDRYISGKEIILKLMQQTLFDPENTISVLLLQDVFFYDQKSSKKNNMHATRQIIDVFASERLQSEEIFFERAEWSVFEILNLLPVDVDFLETIYAKGVNIHNIFYFRTAVKQLVIRGDAEKLESLLEILNHDREFVSFILNLKNVINSGVGPVFYHEIAKVVLSPNKSEKVIEILQKYGMHIDAKSENLGKLIEFQRLIDANETGYLTINSIDPGFIGMFTMNSDNDGFGTCNIAGETESF